MKQKHEHLTVDEMHERAKKRPANYEALTAEEQWQIDKELGILDWVGKRPEDLVKRIYRPSELEDIRTRISQTTYEASSLFERHEQYHGRGKGCVLGNGHHIRQEMARKAVTMFVERLRPEYRAWYESDGLGGYRLKTDAKAKETQIGQLLQLMAEIGTTRETEALATQIFGAESSLLWDSEGMRF